MTLTSEPAARSSIDRVWDALDLGGFKPEKRGDKFMALCPVHGDSHRSLSVKYDRNRQAVLFNCFTCSADIRDIAAQLNLSVQDFFDTPPPPRGDTSTRAKRVAFKAPHKIPTRVTQTPVAELRDAKWTEVTRYPYTDAAGTIVEEVVREQTVVDGVTHKRFTQRFLGASGRMVSRKPADFSPVLYQHPAVLEAITAGKPIWLVEGEKDADNATALGLCATTNAQGAGSFPEELAAVLKGATINLVADRDVAGYKRAETLHELLTAKGATVRILLPALDEDKADLTDHLEAGNGIDQLIEISVDDAGVLAQVGEARRAIAAIELCRVEAAARLDLASAANNETAATHRAAAETWATEAELRFRRLRDGTKGAALFAHSYGTIGKAAADQLPAVVAAAAAVAAEVFNLVDVKVPASITESLATSGARVVDLSSAGGAQPPRYRGDDFIRGDDGSENVGTTYLVRKGQTVQLKIERDGDSYRNRYHRIFDGWAEVQDVAVDDDGSDSTNTRAAHEMTVKFSRWVRDVHGDPELDEDDQAKIEEVVVRWDADQMRDGSWAQALPWPGMLEKTSRSGKDIAWDAIHKARRSPVDRTVVYTTSGWRQSDAGPFFVHAGGAIAKGGSLPLNIDLPDAFSPYKMPAPSIDAAELRAAWDAGTAPLLELPARIVAPLLGVVWESVFERVPMLVHFQGGRASFKTSCARLGLQYFAPELNYHGKREILSGANMGGTIIGLTRALAIANHLPVLIDDIAPDGDVKAAQKKLSSIARIVYNGTSRIVGKQRGGIDSGDSIEATVITTGEMGVTGSAQTRILTLPLDPGTFPDGGTTFAELERSSSRNARGLLGSSLIQWVAQNRQELLDEKAAMIDDPTAEGSTYAYWKKRLAALPYDSGLVGRLIDPAVIADHGIKLMLRMMVRNNAMTRDEADAFFAWAEAGIFEAVSMQDSSAGDPAEQLIGYLREALVSGDGHLTTEKGGRPHDIANGWALRGDGDFATWMAGGRKLGIVKEENGEERVYLVPSVVLGVVNQVAQRADETFAETNVSVSSAMVSHGWLKTDNSGKRGVGRRINGQVTRVWDIPLSVLTGDDDSDPKTTSPTTAPTLDPSLFDTTAPQTTAPTAAATPERSRGAEHSAGAAAARGTGTRKQAANGSFRASVAVLHTDGLWLPDGELIQLGKPIEHLGDVAKLVAELNLGTKNGWRNEDGQVLVTYDAALQLGIPVDQLTKSTMTGELTKSLQDLTLNHQLVTKAVDAGFNIGGKVPALNASTRIWMPGNDRLRARFVLLPTLKDDFRHILEGDPTPAAIARRLQRFADTLHAPYAVSSATTGIDLMLALHWKDRETLFAPSNPVPPAEIATLEADIDWQRKPTGDELEHEYVHAYDRGGSYLAGISGLELGIGDPRYFPDGHTFDKRLPGYWKVTMPEKAEWLTPNPLDPRNRDEDIAGRETWLTTPTLDIATELGYTFEVHEAYVWEQHSRLLDTWYERVRDARTALDTDDVDEQAARDLLKEVYVRSLGMMASFEHHKGRPGFAPERYHAIQARSRANIIRRIHKIGTETGRWPVAVSKDTVLYTSNDPDPIKAWPGAEKDFGRGLGQFKYERSGELAQQLQFLTGRGRYEGKEHLDINWIG